MKALEKKTLSMDMAAPHFAIWPQVAQNARPRGVEPTQVRGLFGRLWKRKPMGGVFFLLVVTWSGFSFAAYGYCWNGLGLLLEKRRRCEKREKVHAEKACDGDGPVDRKARRASFVFLVHLLRDIQGCCGLGGGQTEGEPAVTKAGAKIAIPPGGDAIHFFGFALA